jgi:hypothetical protein
LALTAVAQKQQTPAKPPGPGGGVIEGVIVPSSEGPRLLHPWELSDEERISRRLALGHPANGGGARSLQAESGYREAINGLEHPELFFSYELFDGLLKGVSSDDRQHGSAHRVFDPKIRANGYDVSNFWTTLETISSRYVQMREEHRRQNKSTTILRLPDGTPILVPVNREVCAARYDALQETRRAFGGRTFDRFLYQSVAPELSHSEGGSSSGRSEQLRFMAGGCK